MRKLLLITIVLLLLFCIACTDSKGAATVNDTPPASPITAVSETPQPRVTFEPWEKYQDVVPMIQFDWGTYQSLDEFVDEISHITVATVVDIEVFLYDEEPEREGDLLQDTMIKYTVSIDEPLKGGLAQGGTIAAWQRGWRYNDVNLWHPYIPPLEYDRTYLLFFNKNDYPFELLDVDYYLGMSFESYPEIKDGKLYPHPYSNLFSEGQPLEDTVSSITQLVEKKTALLNALMDLSAEQGTESLGSLLTDDQVPVRQLTPDEIQTYLDLPSSEVIKETAGSELENSDVFVWIKTDELTKAQQETFEAALRITAAEIADERSWGYEVCVTPFHSLVCIARGEDRATILDHFHRILDELAEKES